MFFPKNRLPFLNQFFLTQRLKSDNIRQSIPSLRFSFNMSLAINDSSRLQSNEFGKRCTKVTKASRYLQSFPPKGLFKILKTSFFLILRLTYSAYFSGIMVKSNVATKFRPVHKHVFQIVHIQLFHCTEAWRRTDELTL